MRFLLSLSICFLALSQWPAFGLDKAASTKGKGVAKSDGKPNVEKNESGEDIDFGPYMQDLQRKIKRAWFPPKSNDSSSATVVFEINRNGTLGTLRLSKSSGNKAVDQSGLMAVRNASPFQKLPLGSPEKVDVQFNFDYNVFRGSNGSYSNNTGATLGNKHQELLKAGREAFLAKKYDVALQKFDEAEKYASFTEREIKVYRATIYDRQGTQILAKDPKAAADLYRKALLLAPHSPFVSKNLDQALDKQGIKSNSYKERAALADKFISQNAYDLAEIECSRALRLALDEERKEQTDPDKQAISVDRKALETQLAKISSTIKGRREEERWRAYLQFHGNSAEGYLGLAFALEQQGKIDEAKKAVEDALVASPRNEAAELHLKRLKGLAGDVTSLPKPAQ